MVQKRGSERMTDKDAAVYHRCTMRHCPHQDRKDLRKWLSSSDGVFIWVLIIPEMTQKNLVYVSFGAYSAKKSKFLHRKMQKSRKVIGVFANCNYLCS